MSKTKKIVYGCGLIAALVFLIINLEIAEYRLDQPGYTYIGSALTGVLRVDAETGATSPCFIGEGVKVYCLTWKK